MNEISSLLLLLIVTKSLYFLSIQFCRTGYVWPLTSRAHALSPIACYIVISPPYYSIKSRSSLNFSVQQVLLHFLSLLLNLVPPLSTRSISQIESLLFSIFIKITQEMLIKKVINLSISHTCSLRFSNSIQRFKEISKQHDNFCVKSDDMKFCAHFLQPFFVNNLFYFDTKVGFFVYVRRSKIKKKIPPKQITEAAKQDEIFLLFLFRFFRVQ